METLVVLVGLSGVSYFSSSSKIRSMPFRNASVLVIPNFSQYASNLRAVCSSSLALTSIFLGFLEGGLPFCELILSRIIQLSSFEGNGLFSFLPISWVLLNTPL